SLPYFLSRPKIATESLVFEAAKMYVSSVATASATGSSSAFAVAHVPPLGLTHWMKLSSPLTAHAATAKTAAATSVAAVGIVKRLNTGGDPVSRKGGRPQVMVAMPGVDRQPAARESWPRSADLPNPRCAA